MALQSVLVFLVVACCFVYAAWTLMPQSVRRGLANGMLRWPLPPVLRTIVQRGARSSGSCHCDGCDRAPPERALVFHPKIGQKTQRLTRSKTDKAA